MVEKKRRQRLKGCRPWFPASSMKQVARAITGSTDQAVIKAKALELANDPDTFADILLKAVLNVQPAPQVPFVNTPVVQVPVDAPEPITVAPAAVIDHTISDEDTDDLF